MVLGAGLKMRERKTDETTLDEIIKMILGPTQDNNSRE